tara:strand:- start:1606 stop:1824 length:219 start_codon:yes stop_codon:yes gene_type:complete
MWDEWFQLLMKQIRFDYGIILNNLGKLKEAELSIREAVELNNQLQEHILLYLIFNTQMTLKDGRINSFLKAS